MLKISSIKTLKISTKYTPFGIILLVASFNVNAQSCTILNGSSSSMFSLANNQCVQVTSTGSITVGGGEVAIYGGFGLTGLVVSNAGTLTAGSYGYGIGSDGGTFTYIANTGIIAIAPTSIITSSGIRLQNFASAVNVVNSGQIQGGMFGISSTNSITNLTNTGSIYASGSGYNIFNQGAISTLNNLQGGNSSSAATTALTYSGNLPTNYNIIIRSLGYYGQLAVTSPGGSTTFGIYAGGVDGVAVSTLTKGTYTSVLSGITSSNLTGATSGSYNGFNWRLNNSSGSIWDLVVTGASTADTQQSFANTAQALQNTYTLQNSVLANSFSYDCDVFGANDVCISAGGRNTAVSAANGLSNTSALLIAAYRVMPSVRIGAYADQNLSVNNVGSTVNLGNNTPLVGLFGAWNERLDGTGTEVKVSAAYGQKSTTVTRAVVGTSEAGTGGSQLNSQGAQVTAKYGFGVAENVIVSPYVGIRYTQSNMGGYTEGTSSTVTAPLTYSALNTNATTALAGVGAQYKFIPQATVFAGAGVESDTNTNNGTYSATGIVGLTPINFNLNPVKTRPTATLGAYFDTAKNQHLGITGIYRQEAYQATATTTVMATYMVGL